MRARLWAIVAVLAIVVVLAIGLAQLPGGPSATAGPTATATPGRGGTAGLPTSPSPVPAASMSASVPTSRPPTPAAPAIPAFGHVFVIVMENKEYGSIIGNPDAPYINGLARRYGLATDYTAVAHPSEPNYLALWSGSTRGVTDDGIHDFTSGQTLADQIEAAGRSWHVAAQNVPLGCYTGGTASGGPDGSGTYARKHEPAISWTSVSGDAPRCARITDFGHFDPNAGSFWLIVPNLCNDMHDCSVATGDTFLKGFLPMILDSAAFANGVVFLTWDEGSTSVGGGGKVPLIVISPTIRSGFTSATRHDHYSLVRTIEEAWGMPCLANACSADDLREFFR